MIASQDKHSETEALNCLAQLARLIDECLPNAYVAFGRFRQDRPHGILIKANLDPLRAKYNHALRVLLVWPADKLSRLLQDPVNYIRWFRDNLPNLIPQWEQTRPIDFAGWSQLAGHLEVIDLEVA